jgi:chemotaxis protein MotB
MSASAEEKPDGAPEWMVSYADMITIIMSFFVIMFAIASGAASKGKTQWMNQDDAVASLQYRFGPKWKPFSNWGPMPGNSSIRTGGDHGGKKFNEPPAGDTDGTNKMPKKLPRYRLPGHGDRVVIGGVVFFGRVNTNLDNQQKAWLQVIADEMAGKPQQVEVEGYVSTQPLPADSPFKDRRELAFARCRQTADLLARMKIDPERIRIAIAPQTERRMPGESSTVPPEESRVDVFLTDTLTVPQQ